MQGVWLLDLEELYFVVGLDRRASGGVVFVDIGSSLGINVTDKSFIVVRDEESLYVFSSGIVQLLTCSEDCQKK